MSKRLLTILLLISLFLNAGIIGGLIVMGIFRHNHFAHHEIVQPGGPQRSERRSFDPRLREDPAIKTLADSFRTSKQRLMQELARDTVDQQRIRAIIDSSVESQVRLEQALGQKLLQERLNMTAEEAWERFGRRNDRLKEYNDRRPPQ